MSSRCRWAEQGHAGCLGSMWARGHMVSNSGSHWLSGQGEQVQTRDTERYQTSQQPKELLDSSRSLKLARLPSRLKKLYCSLNKYPFFALLCCNDKATQPKCITSRYCFNIGNTQLAFEWMAKLLGCHIHINILYNESS